MPLSKQQVNILHQWPDLDYEVKVEHLRRVARGAGFDKGWAERNVRNMERIIKKLPTNRSLTEHDIDIKASFLLPPDQT